MDSRMGLPSCWARASASGPHGYQSTGLCECWRRYGLVWAASRLIVRAARLSIGPLAISSKMARHYNGSSVAQMSVIAEEAATPSAGARLPVLRLKRGED